MMRSCPRLRVLPFIALASAACSLVWLGQVPRAAVAAGASQAALPPPAADTGSAAPIYPWSDISALESASGASDLARLVGRRGSGEPLQAPSAASATAMFRSPPTLLTRPTPTCVQAADLDDDGHLDLAVAEHMGPSVVVFYGDGTGAFPASVRLEFASRPTWVEPIDMNGDGRLDLVTASWNWPTSEGLIRIAFNDGDRAWSMGEWDHTGFFPVQIVMRDWNRDGLPDAATANYLGWSVSLLRNVGGGRLQAVAELPTSPEAASLAFTDLEADGFDDLVVTGMGCNFADTFRHVGGDSWLPGSGVGVQWWAYSVAMTDLDGAHGPDVVIGSGNGAASVLVNDGRGRFAGWTDYATHAAPVHILTPDLDRDGAPDLVASHYAASAITPLLNRGGAGFIPVAAPAPGSAPIGYAAGPGATASAAGDFDEDGQLDLAVADAGGTFVSLMFGRADGTLAANRLIATGSTPWSVAVADFDRDGIQDLVVALPYIDRVGVLLGREDGSFAAQVQYPTGVDPVAVATGDLDADGAPDLVTANHFSGDVSVLLNRGDGTFLPRTDYVVGAKPLSIAIGDFDRNTHPDLAVSCHDDHVIRLFAGVGSGRFILRQHMLKTRDGPAGVIVLDFNDDGWPDLAGANYTAGSVSTWLNSGSGTFVSPSTVGSRWGCWALAAGQVIPGGPPEIVSVNRRADTVSLLEINQWGMVTRYTHLVVGTSPSGAVVADFDADGDDDVAVTNFNAANMVVLENAGGTLTPRETVPIGRMPVGIAAIDVGGDGSVDLAAAMQEDRTVVVIESLRGPAGGTTAVAPSAGSALTLRPPSPNPSRGAVSVAFTIPTRAIGRLSVVDVSGREIALLRSGAFDAGPGLAGWDGRDARGRPVRSGVYFLLLQSGDRLATARFTVMR